METIHSTEENCSKFLTWKTYLGAKPRLVRDRGVTSMSNRQLPSPECTAQRRRPFVVLAG